MKFTADEVQRAYHAAKSAAHCVIPGVSPSCATLFRASFKQISGYEGATVPNIEHYDKESKILSITGGLPNASL
jgi:hypothetical protein